MISNFLGYILGLTSSTIAFSCPAFAQLSSGKGREHPGQVAGCFWIQIEVFVGPKMTSTKV